MAAHPSDREQTIVIGGGAAGLLAAGHAAERGIRVLLLEKMAQPGRKIGISGKGRCNISNSAELTEFLDHFGRNGKFLRQCFQQFFSSDLLQLLQKNGVETVLERGGRYFPQSGKAMDIVRALRGWAQGNGATIRCHSPVETILTKEKAVCGVIVDGKEYACRNIIIATGGRSYPRTGSTGDGYTLLGKLGHTIIQPRPALVPLCSAAIDLQALNGLSLRNIAVQLFINGKKKASQFGEIAFLDNRITGPTVLTISDAAVYAINTGKQVSLVLDAKPALDETRLDARLRRDLEKRQGERIDSILRGLLPAKLIPFCITSCGIAANTTVISAKKRQRLRHWLKNIALPISGYGTWDEAIVTAGGVSLKEVDPHTMQSRRIKGLYIAGELLDLHGDTGGFNLQAAFSSGWLAGNSIPVHPTRQ